MKEWMERREEKGTDRKRKRGGERSGWREGRGKEGMERGEEEGRDGKRGGRMDGKWGGDFLMQQLLSIPSFPLCPFLLPSSESLLLCFCFLHLPPSISLPLFSPSFLCIYFLYSFLPSCRRLISANMAAIQMKHMPSTTAGPLICTERN